MENFLAENYASSLENNFFPFHAVLFCNCKTGQLASRGNTCKKAFFLPPPPQQHLKYQLCGNEQLC